VYVGGVPAYSTLGWLNDPVLNTFIHYPATQIAPLIFHELAHQVVYVPDDSIFNESFATTVEMEGARRWLAREGTAEQRAAFEAFEQRKVAFARLIRDYREKLKALYASSLSDEQKREQKKRVIQALREEYGRLKAAWGGFSGYDHWFAGDINNAQLASVALYTQMVPAFQALLSWEGGDLPQFYRAVKQIAKVPKTDRLATLQRLIGTTSANAAVPGAETAPDTLN
jgi:predicted aminopeptidase